MAASGQIEHAETDLTSRRRLLTRLFWGAMGIVSAGIAAPIIAYLAEPLLTSRNTTQSIRLGRIDDLSLNHPQRLEAARREVEGWVTDERQVTAWVVRLPDKLFVFDPHCTHLGCAYRWQEQSKQFFCPCHNGVFDIRGKVVSGPPPRPLDIFEYEVREGSIYVVPVPIQRVV